MSSATRTSTPGNTIPNPTGKVKQTRRRQRLSCVECTRRRQKCDRQIPCGLCTSRGIPHLCKWEPIMARPSPRHPPDAAPQVEAPQQSTIAALSARIAVLEKTLQEQNIELHKYDPPIHSTDHSPITLDEHPVDPPHISPSSSRVPRSLSPSDSTHSCELSHLDFEVQVAAVQMAQLAIAPDNEYVGTGTIPCALHKLGDADSYRFPYARSSTATLTVRSPPGGDPLYTGTMPRLLSYLPSPETTSRLVDGYFVERSWQFGIPERWFRSALDRMWAHLSLQCPGQPCHLNGGCDRCKTEINPHWLSLLFAVLCLAPRRLQGANAKIYFWRAMEARRFVEDLMLSSPAYSAAPSHCVVHGVSLSCIAAALLCAYLADRGRISDAWKISGTAVRNAQAVGLHRDPGWMKWEKMDREEKELRLLGWWFVVISDRMYSLILGRPTIAPEGSFDVRLIPGSRHGDGSENPCAYFQQTFISLIQLVSETITKCLGIESPSYATVIDMDRKFQQWRSKLDPTMDWRIRHRLSDPPMLPEIRAALQRHGCAAYYLGTFMNLHRLYLMQAPPILPLPHSFPDTITSAVLNPSREQCIETAMELVQVLCDAAEECAQWDTFSALPSTVFYYAYFVFDGAVALVGVFAQDPPHPKAKECLALIDRAVEMLEKCRQANAGCTDGEGDTATRAITILKALRKAGRWDERLGLDSPAPASSEGPALSTTTQQNLPDARDIAATLPPIPAMPTHVLASYSNLTAQTAPFPPGLAASFPFLNNVSSQVPSFPLPPMPGPYQVESSTRAGTTLQRVWAVQGADGSGPVAASMDFNVTGNGRSNVQTMVMPFDMLQNHESYDIDWTEIMGPAGGLSSMLDDGQSEQQQVQGF